MTRDYNHLDRWIPKQLARVQLSVEQLAQRAGVSRTAIYRWLYDDDRPTEDNMLKVCRVLDLPLEEGLRQYTPKRVGRPPGSGKGEPKGLRIR